MLHEETLEQRDDNLAELLLFVKELKAAYTRQTNKHAKAGSSLRLYSVFHSINVRYLTI